MNDYAIDRLIGILLKRLNPVCLQILYLFLLYSRKLYFFNENFYSSAAKKLNH